MKFTTALVSAISLAHSYAIPSASGNAAPAKRILKAKAKLIVGSLSRWRGCVGLTYHRISKDSDAIFDRGLWSATPDDFERQLRWLKARFDVITPGDLEDAARIRRGRHVLVTFDDGYRDNHTVAYPILRAHGVPATFYVSTSYIDAPRVPWWDEIAWMVRDSPRSAVTLPGYLPAQLVYDEPTRRRAVRTLLKVYYALPGDATEQFLDAVADATATGRYGGPSAERLWMTWDMLREMHSGGMTIGGHTSTHPILSRLSPEQQWLEISGCAERIQAEIGVPMRTFSYPVGGCDTYDRHTRDCLRRVGVETAFSYYGGFRTTEDWDHLDIRRSGVEHDMTFDEFRALVLAPGLA